MFSSIAPAVLICRRLIGICSKKDSILSETRKAPRLLPHREAAGRISTMVSRASVASRGISAMVICCSIAADFCSSS